MAAKYSFRMAADLLDRVTNAIFASAQARGLAPASSGPDAAWREVGRAALAALGDPTSRMLDAARAYTILRLNPDEAEIWRVMAHAALDADRPARRRRLSAG